MTTTCAFHPELETALSCTNCGRYACPDCLTQMAVGQHCEGCTKGRPAAGEKGSTAFRVKSALVGADDHQRLRRPSAIFYVVVAVFVACCVAAAMVEPAIGGGEVMSGARAAALLVVISGAVVGVMFHEWAHAIVAYFGGDRSVADKGYLTMDIRHYSDPMLSIAMPVVFLLLGGLPLPGGAVWINHNFLRTKWWETAVALAGPAINLLGALGLYAIANSELFGDHYVLRGALAYLAFIEVAIVILNLLPIPGLDGFGAIEPHLPDGVRASVEPLRQYTFILLLVFIMSPASDFIWEWAVSFTQWIGVDSGLPAFGEELASLQLF